MPAGAPAGDMIMRHTATLPPGIWATVGASMVGRGGPSDIVPPPASIHTGTRHMPRLDADADWPDQKTDLHCCPPLRPFVALLRTNSKVIVDAHAAMLSLADKTPMNGPTVPTKPQP